MTASRLNKFWILVIIVLVVAIIAGGVVILSRLSRYSPGQPLEITQPQAEKWQGTIHIHGAVDNPGFYPLRAGDSIDALIQAAGGAQSSANLSGLELYIGGAENKTGAQKIDINRAEAWLLDALPGIGEALAQRIIDYRQQNGPFRNTEELLKVRGIGATVYQRLKNLITVGE